MLLDLTMVNSDKFKKKNYLLFFLWNTTEIINMLETIFPFYFLCIFLVLLKRATLVLGKRKDSNWLPFTGGSGYSRTEKLFTCLLHCHLHMRFFSWLMFFYFFGRRRESVNGVFSPPLSFILNLHSLSSNVIITYAFFPGVCESPSSLM